MYLNSVQIIGFIGKDPERRQARGNGAAFTVLPVATQRSWKNADDEWASKTESHRVVAWNSLGERVAASLRQGGHDLEKSGTIGSAGASSLQVGARTVARRQFFLHAPRRKALWP